MVSLSRRLAAAAAAACAAASAIVFLLGSERLRAVEDLPVQENGENLPCPAVTEP
mgnify:CR=1 FL=1